jgi:capsid assembly protease
MKYERIARAVLTRPWAIKRDSLEWAAVLEVLERRAAGEMLSEEEIQRRIAAVPRRSVAVGDEEASGSIAIIPIHGVLFPKANLMTAMSGGGSVEQLSAAFAEAIDDDRIQAVVLDVDSPGGLVDGIPEFAAQIRGARGTKPIAAIADGMAASAAYWLAAQADELSVTPSGEVGSIGVFSEHENAQKFWEEMGVEHTLISAGRFKTEGNEYEPLSDEARAHIQAIVDDYYAMFVNDVAKGRGIAAADVRSGYGEGRVFTARMAKKMGMVDRIETFGELVGRVGKSLAPRRGRSALEDVGGTVIAARPAVDVEAADPAHADADVAEAVDIGVAAVAEPTDADRLEVELVQLQIRQRRRRTA